MRGTIPEEFINELRERADIVDIVGASVKLKKAGQNYKGLCPFHHEKTPSFTVSADENRYKCFGCEESGDVFSFVMNQENLTFPEAVERIAGHVGLTVPWIGVRPPNQEHEKLYVLLSKAQEFFSRNLLDGQGSEASREYINARNIDQKTKERFGIGFASNSWNALKNVLKDEDEQRLIEAGLLASNDQGHFYDRFRNRITFPIRNRRGRIVGFGGRVINPEDQPKYLNSPETPVYNKGKELYGLYEARQALNRIDRLLVVEGYMDVISLAQFGITYVVAALGTATNRYQFDTMFKVTNQIVCCFDGDRAGRNAAWRALENALPVLTGVHRLRFMFLPEGHDPDTYVREIGKEPFESQMEDAVIASKFLFDELTRELNMDVVDDRSKLVRDAQPLIERINDSVHRSGMYGQLAELARLPLDEVEPRDRVRERLVNEIHPPSYGYSDEFEKELPSPRIKLTPRQHSIMRILVHVPTTIRAVSQTVIQSLKEEFPSNLISIMLDLLNGERDISNTRRLLVRCINEPFQEEVESIAQDAAPVLDEAALSDELIEKIELYLTSLRNERLGREIANNPAIFRQHYGTQELN